MTRAKFKVVFAGPLVSFQDAGRTGHLRFGVSTSGPMDRFAHAAAFAMLGQDRRASSIEVSLGGLVMECTHGEVTLAISGGSFSINDGKEVSEGWCVKTVEQGDRLTIRAGSWGSWAYLAFHGSLVLEDWLGATSTHSMSGFGGGTLRAGLEFEVRDAAIDNSREGAFECPKVAKTADQIRVVIGPQDQHFSPESVKAFCEHDFILTDAFDRMGVRLNGPSLALENALSIPSEPIIRGSVQVSGDGVPTVLLADHQTTGGYPKIATLLSCDVDKFSQLRANDRVRFMPVSAEAAVKAAREHSEETRFALADLSSPRATLDERLQSQNLIGGVVLASNEID